MAASNQAYNRSYKPVNEKRAFAERSKLRERLDKVYDRCLLYTSDDADE